MITTEKDIIARCQQGDTAAFRYVVEQYQTMLLTLGLKMLGDEEEAKDIVQDTFLKAWEHIGQYDSRYALSTWLYTIASRLCMTRMKRLRQIAPLPEDEQVLRRYMNEMDIYPIYPKMNLSKRMQQAKVCPYLLRNAVIDKPNQAWSIDITYIPIKRGFLYLTAVVLSAGKWMTHLIPEWLSVP